MVILAYDPFVSRERAQSMGVELLELSELLPPGGFHHRPYAQDPWNYAPHWP